MKKILFLLLSTIAMYGQVPADATPLENIQITNNTTDNSATKVNVQSTDGTINTISKYDLVNVVEVNDVPSLPLIGESGKIYVVKNVNKIYRWNGTFYQELAVTDISGKINVSEKGVTVATLEGGKIPNSQIPALAISETFPVSSQAQMLALSQADQGDVAIRSDISKSFILRVSPSSVLANWSELLSPTDAVTSVAGKVGVVTLNTSDIGGLQTALDLKANNSDVVKLTGNQIINGEKTFRDRMRFENQGGIYSGINRADMGSTLYMETGQALPGIYLESKSASAALRASNITGGKVLEFGFSGSGGDITNSGVFNGSSFVKKSTPANNILLAGGGDIAQGTAFNKNFGTTSGTVAEGNYPPAKDGTGANGTWGINISGNSSSATSWGGSTASFSIEAGVINFATVFEAGVAKYAGVTKFQSWLGLGSNAYSSTAYLPLSGGTLTGTVTATSYTATSLPVFENNAAASSLAVGQFYRTSTGVLMVKF